MTNLTSYTITAIDTAHWDYTVQFSFADGVSFTQTVHLQPFVDSTGAFSQSMLQDALLRYAHAHHHGLMQAKEQEADQAVDTAVQAVINVQVTNPAYSANGTAA